MGPLMQSEKAFVIEWLTANWKVHPLTMIKYFTQARHLVGGSGKA